MSREPRPVTQGDVNRTCKGAVDAGLVTLAGIPRHHSYPPRGLRRPSAARWLGFGQTKFAELVAEGRLPKPRRIDGVVIWDRYELDEAFDDLADAETRVEPSDHSWSDVDA